MGGNTGFEFIKETGLKSWTHTVSASSKSWVEEKRLRGVLGNTGMQRMDGAARKAYNKVERKLKNKLIKAEEL